LFFTLYNAYNAHFWLSHHNPLLPCFAVGLRHSRGCLDNVPDAIPDAAPHQQLVFF
jgi:hypothetical protein